MAAHAPGPTAYADVNAVLQQLLASIQAILGKRFLGMYVDGSLAAGDFDPRRSDIDFVVATDGELSDEQFTALHAMHEQFAARDSPWATEVECFYLPAQALRRQGPPGRRYPRVERGRGALRMEPHDTDWVVHRSVLRDRGIVVAGPAVACMIDPVQPDELRRAVAESVCRWWATMDDDDVRPLHRRGYQAYVVLTMCRVLSTLETGGVVSKPVAARWAQATLGDLWIDLIERAVAWQKDQQDDPGDDVAATVALIRYTVERCRHVGRTTDPAR